MRYKCKTCGGEYDDVCEDGLAYYHACSDITDKDEKTAPRPDKRDENVAKKLEGKGRIKLD